MVEIKNIWLSSMVALIGMIWQVINLSEMYFAYDTITELDLQWPKTISVPSLAYCALNVDRNSSSNTTATYELSTWLVPRVG